METGRIEFEAPTFREFDTDKIQETFRTFGGGKGSNTNPIANALKDTPLAFAAGVDVQEVATFVIAHQPPIDMILPCPACGTLHVDAPEPDICECSHVEDRHSENGQCVANRSPMSGEDRCPCSQFKIAWDNPPHKTHLCHGCGIKWRPADVPTNGVAEIKTRGENDTWPKVSSL